MAVNKGKAKKILSQAFIDSNAEITEDEALDKIFNSLTNVKDLEEEMKNDDKLNAAQQIVTDLKKGYNSAINNEKAKIAFLRDKIEELRTDEPNTDGVDDA